MRRTRKISTRLVVIGPTSAFPGGSEPAAAQAGRDDHRGTSIQGSKASVEQVTMKALDDNRVVIRAEACQVCYSITGQAVANYKPAHSTVITFG